MSKIKNGGLDQYGTRPFELQQFGTAGAERVDVDPIILILNHDLDILQTKNEVTAFKS